VAIDTQTVVVGGSGTGTTKEYIPLTGGGLGILPMARMVMRGAIALDGSGAGDTAELSLESTLPDNVVWQCTSLFHTIQWADLPAAPWSLAQFEYAASPDGTAPTDLFYPMIVFPTDVSGKQGIALGNAGAGPIQGAMPGVQGQTPFANFTFAVAGDIYRFRLAGPDTTDSDSTLTFYWTWLAYTFEQARAAPLHIGFNNLR